MTQDDNIVKLPDPLERRAKKINTALEKRENAFVDWVECTIEIAIELAAAKRELADTTKFGAWCDYWFSGSLSPNERAILIKWGNAPEHTKEVLYKTKSTSIQLIHSTEWRVTSASKSSLAAPPVQQQLPLQPSPPLPPLPPLPPKTPPMPAAQPTHKSTPQPHKQSQAAVLKQLGREEAIRQGKTVPPLPLDVETVNSIYKQVRDAAAAVPDLAGKAKRAFEKILAAEMTKLVAELRLYQERAAIEMPGKIAEAVTQRVATQFPDYEKRILAAREREEYYGKLVKAVKVPLTEAEYTNLVMCCHPDNSASKERRDTALQVLNAKRFSLTGKK